MRYFWTHNVLSKNNVFYANLKLAGFRDAWYGSTYTFWIICCDRHASVLCFRSTQPLVYSGVRSSLRTRISLWFSSGRLAVRVGGSYLVNCGFSALLSRMVPDGSNALGDIQTHALSFRSLGLWSRSASLRGYPYVLCTRDSSSNKFQCASLLKFGTH